MQNEKKVSNSYVHVACKFVRGKMLIIMKSQRIKEYHRYQFNGNLYKKEPPSVLKEPP